MNTRITHIDFFDHATTVAFAMPRTAAGLVVGVRPNREALAGRLMR